MATALRLRRVGRGTRGRSGHHLHLLAPRYKRRALASGLLQNLPLLPRFVCIRMQFAFMHFLTPSCVVSSARFSTARSALRCTLCALHAPVIAVAEYGSVRSLQRFPHHRRCSSRVRPGKRGTASQWSVRMLLVVTMCSCKHALARCDVSPPLHHCAFDSDARAPLRSRVTPLQWRSSTGRNSNLDVECSALAPRRACTTGALLRLGVGRDEPSSSQSPARRWRTRCTCM